MPEETTSQSPIASESFFERDEDFASLYANNVQFETSVWDLKIIFGQLDQSRPSGRVDQHTAITLPWLQAKIMAFYLSANVALYEADNGKIQIPLSLQPQPLPPVPDHLKDIKSVQEGRAYNPTSASRTDRVGFSKTQIDGVSTL